MTSYYAYSAVPILILIGIAVVAGYAAWNRRRTQKENLRRIARTFGFTFSEPESGSSFVRLIGGWEMTGTYNGIAVRIYGKKVSGPERSSESTFIDATANCRVKCELMITRETTLSRIGGAVFGLQDVTTGNADVDRRVVVKGVPTHIVKRIVDNHKLQQEVVRLFEHDGLIHVDLHGAHYRRSGVLTDDQTLRALLDALTRTASALEKATA
jgi:hypothetical protein